MTREHDKKPPWAPNGSDNYVWGQILSHWPIVIFSLETFGFPLGAASLFGPKLKRYKAHFLFMLPWTLELGLGEALAERAIAYRTAHPRHTLTFLCNTEREVELLLARGLDGRLLGSNSLVNDQNFHPMPEIEPIYDAVYNARLTPMKRTELACEIDKLALIYFYQDVMDGSPDAFHARHADLRAMMPSAYFINELTLTGSKRLSRTEINHVLAQSRVGLCLSAVEGQMFASIEYLFAGLSVVSTPSHGGRDVFFDDEYCIICEPDPRSVREAVEALVARNVPRDYIRTKTLARVDRMRRQFVDVVEEKLDRHGRMVGWQTRFEELLRNNIFFCYRTAQEFEEALHVPTLSQRGRRFLQGLAKPRQGPPLQR